MRVGFVVAALTLGFAVLAACNVAKPRYREGDWVAYKLNIAQVGIIVKTHCTGTRCDHWIAFRDITGLVKMPESLLEPAKRPVAPTSCTRTDTQVIRVVSGVNFNCAKGKWT